MIIILKKDGTVVTDDGNPVEGVKLENAAAILADPKDGDTIVYDATAGMWVAGTGGGSFEPDITNPQDGDTLVYDASEGKWVNGSGGGGGGVLVVHDNEGTLDKTWKEIHDAGFAVMMGEAYKICIGIILDEGDYIVSFLEYGISSPVTYIATTETGYPVLQS